MLKNSISEKMPPQGAESPAADRSYSVLGNAAEYYFHKSLKNSNLPPPPFKIFLGVKL